MADGRALGHGGLFGDVDDVIGLGDGAAAGGAVGAFDTEQAAVGAEDALLGSARADDEGADGGEVEGFERFLEASDGGASGACGLYDAGDECEVLVVFEFFSEGHGLRAHFIGRGDHGSFDEALEPVADVGVEDVFEGLAELGADGEEEPVEAAEPELFEEDLGGVFEVDHFATLDRAGDAGFLPAGPTGDLGSAGDVVAEGADFLHAPGEVLIEPGISAVNDANGDALVVLQCGDKGRDGGPAGDDELGAKGVGHADGLEEVLVGTGEDGEAGHIHLGQRGEEVVNLVDVGAYGGLFGVGAVSEEAVRMLGDEVLKAQEDGFSRFGSGLEAEVDGSNG